MRHFGDGPRARGRGRGARHARRIPSATSCAWSRCSTGTREQEVVCGAPNVPAPAGAWCSRSSVRVLPGGMRDRPARARRRGFAAACCAASASSMPAATSPASSCSTRRRTSDPGSSPPTRSRLRDTVYELSLTPNRPDCLGHVGLARELCALFEAPFALARAASALRGCAGAPPSLLPQRDARVRAGLGAPARGASEDSARRPVTRRHRGRASAARASGAALVDRRRRSAPSPFWLRHRLHVLGLRAISNVVDVTNYVLAAVRPSDPRVRLRSRARLAHRSAPGARGRAHAHARRRRARAQRRRPADLRRRRPGRARRRDGRRKLRDQQPARSAC